MKENKILCPNCASADTRRLNGPFRMSAWSYQQRHECQQCGQRFITWWSGEFLRCYEPNNMSTAHASV